MDFGLDLDLVGSEKEDFTCPICMYILIHPVTMPCGHSLCKPCYTQCVEKTNLTCPLCRLRISSWARKQSRANSLVDRDKWEAVQRAFPIQVKNRLEDKESSDDEWESVHNFETELRKRKDLSKPGAIRQEYEAALAQLQRQEEEEKKKEEEASAALIKALQEEEEEEMAELEKQREQNERKGIEAAVQLNEEENSKARPSCSTRSAGPSTKNKGANKLKTKRCNTASLKLDTFYEKIRRSSCSMPQLLSERAPTPSRSKVSSSDLDKELSPYPYICRSPSDKYHPTPSPSTSSNSEWNVPLEPHLSEHSYTTASAKRINLTSESHFYMSCRRCDIEPTHTVVKLEPLDPSLTFEPEDPISSFQPIESFIRTPPRKLPSGQSVEASVIKAVPRNLSFDDPVQNSASRPTGTAAASTSMSIEKRFEAAEICRKNVLGMNGKQNVCIPLRHSATLGKPSRKAASETASSCSPAVSMPESTKLDMVWTASYKKDANDNIAVNVDDDIITEDTPLVLPLEPDCNIENEFDPLLIVPSKSLVSEEESDKLTSRKDTDKKPLLQELNTTVNNHSDRNDNRSSLIDSSSQLKPTCSKRKHSSKNFYSRETSTSSKGKRPRTVPNMSIRQFCVPSNLCNKPTDSQKRKLSNSSDSLDGDNFNVDDSLCEKPLSQEEADHLYALELQKMYCTLDKRGIAVDRHKGSKDEYLFRKRRRL